MSAKNYLLSGIIEVTRMGRGIAKMMMSEERLKTEATII